MVQRNYTRRAFIKTLSMSATMLTLFGCNSAKNTLRGKPNILFCISDDQSWLHAGAYGNNVVKTPHFDRVARKGVLFTQAYCAAPSCSPSRAAILTGQQIWRLEEGGNLWGRLPAKFPVYPELLMEAGYYVGYTMKGWAPGSVEASGRSMNPAGTAYNKIKNKSAYQFNDTAYISDIDYAANFEYFLNRKPKDIPFCFWFGCYEPHRIYKTNIGKDSGMDPDKVIVPLVMPDVPEIRNDLLDYMFEIQHFDNHLGRMIKTLEERNLFDSTIIVVTSDNGMPFPRAKANLYDLGTRMPLAICWEKSIPGNRVVEDFVSLTDLAPTFLEAAELEIPPYMTGHSLMNILTSYKSGQVELKRDLIVTARERHAWGAREGNLGYPCRAIRTYDFLYIRNYEPERWPAGDPPYYGDIDVHDLAYYSASKEYMIRHQNDPDVNHLFQLAFGKRPSEELYDVRKDPNQMDNIADNPGYAIIKKSLADQLTEYLKNTRDPRALGLEAKWDAYPHYGREIIRERRKSPFPLPISK